MVGEIERSQAGIPVLLRQYLRLGGKLLGLQRGSEVLPMPLTA